MRTALNIVTIVMLQMIQLNSVWAEGTPRKKQKTSCHEKCPIAETAKTTDSGDLDRNKVIRVPMGVLFEHNYLSLQIQIKLVRQGTQHLLKLKEAIFNPKVKDDTKVFSTLLQQMNPSLSWFQKTAIGLSISTSDWFNQLDIKEDRSFVLLSVQSIAKTLSGTTSAVRSTQERMAFYTKRLEDISLQSIGLDPDCILEIYLNTKSRLDFYAEIQRDLLSNPLLALLKQELSADLAKLQNDNITNEERAEIHEAPITADQAILDELPDDFSDFIDSFFRDDEADAACDTCKAEIDEALAFLHN